MEERAVELLVWFTDGAPRSIGPGAKPGKRALPEVSIGRTTSKRALGFIVRGVDGRQETRFVLDREQVKMLVPYLTRSLRRLRATKTKSRK